MSSEPTKITKEINDYIEGISNSEDDFLRDLSHRAINEGIPDIAISGTQGKYIQFLLKSINAKNVLEFGTLAGYSSIIMARALPEDGKLKTIEIETKHAEFARNMIDKANLSKKIEVIISDARKFVDKYSSHEPLDFVFVDADKKDYYYIFEKISPYIRKGGVFAADNALAFGDIVSDNPEEPENVEAIREFNKRFLQNNNYFTCIVPIGDGLALGIKK